MAIARLLLRSAPAATVAIGVAVALSSCRPTPEPVPPPAPDQPLIPETDRESPPVTDESPAIEPPTAPSAGADQPDGGAANASERLPSGEDCPEAADPDTDREGCPD
jgi:hypothetical protein